jgi:hypothetical protein
VTDESTVPRRKRGVNVRPHGHPDRMPTDPSPRGGKRVTKASIERDARAMTLRSEGWTLQQISDELKFGGAPNVVEAIKRWTLRTVQEPADAVREQLLAQLDAALNVAMVALRADVPVLHQGEPVHVVHPVTGQTVWLRDLRTNLAAVDRVERLVDRRAGLLGVKEAERIDVTVTSDAHDEVAALLREVSAHNVLLRDHLAALPPGKTDA